MLLNELLFRALSRKKSISDAELTHLQMSTNRAGIYQYIRRTPYSHYRLAGV